MKILAIESSCDETAAAIISDDFSSSPSPTASKSFIAAPRILSNVVVSQIDIFAAYGGVIPEVAARSHLEAILPVIHQALNDAHLTPNDIDCIAVTYAPGLLGSLLIGTLTARMLAILWHKPLYAVHHLKSHIYSNWLPNSLTPSQEQDNIMKPHSPLHVCPQPQVGAPAPHFSASLHEGENAPNNIASDKPFSRENKSESKLDSQSASPVKTGAEAVLSKKAFVDAAAGALPSFPLLSLVISGGHTQIIYMPEHNHFEIIGTTRDDAVGECFDKVAKILGLPYPGGPSIAACAVNGDSTKYPLPHPHIDDLDFSFSGLKTAVLRAVQSACSLPITTPSHELAQHLTAQQKSDFAASFQSTACDILLEKLQSALAAHPEVKSLVFAGGVSANQALREKAKQKFRHYSPDLCIFFPDPKYTGDNAAMVGAAAYYEILSGVAPVDPYQLNILPRVPIK